MTAFGTIDYGAFADQPAPPADTIREAFITAQANFDKIVQRVPVAITDYGAVADNGTTDNYTAINNAWSAALAEERALFIPPSVNSYYYGTTLSVSPIVPVFGAGPYRSDLIYTGVGNALTLVATSGGSLLTQDSAMRWHGFSLGPAATGGGSLGAFIQTDTNKNIFFFDIYDVHIGVFNGYSMSWLNLTPGSGSMAYGKIEKCYFGNGFFANDIADAVKILGNFFDGPNASYCRGLYLKVGTGSRQIIVDMNTVTTPAGALLENMFGSTFSRNQCEFNGQPFRGDAAFAGFAAQLKGPMGQINFWNCRNTEVIGNSVDTNIVPSPDTLPAYAIIVDGDISPAPTEGLTQQVILRGNEMTAGTTGHIKFGTGARRSRIDWNDYRGVTPIITNSGTNCTVADTKNPVLVAIDPEWHEWRPCGLVPLMGDSSAGDTLGASQTRFVGTHAQSATETDVIFKVPYAGTLRNLVVKAQATPRGSPTTSPDQSFTYTLRVGAPVDGDNVPMASSTLTCVQSGAATSASDVNQAHNVTVTADSWICLQAVSTAGVVPSGRITWSVELLPSFSST